MWACLGILAFAVPIYAFHQRISEHINTFTGRSIHFLLIFVGEAMQLVTLPQQDRRLYLQACSTGSL